jgi:hypothetical protein
MADSRLRNRFDFGARPSWSTTSPASAPGTPAGSGSQSLPGAYIPDDPVNEIPHTPVNEETRLPEQNRDKTCRICLSGVEDGIF